MKDDAIGVMQIARERDDGSGRYPRKAASSLGNAAEQGVQCAPFHLRNGFETGLGSFFFSAGHAVLL